MKKKNKLKYTYCNRKMKSKTFHEPYAYRGNYTYMTKCKCGANTRNACQWGKLSFFKRTNKSIVFGPVVQHNTANGLYL
jgi:hypothetical protein